jgi:hypothetical protein
LTVHSINVDPTDFPFDVASRPAIALLSPARFVPPPFRGQSSRSSLAITNATS